MRRRITGLLLLFLVPAAILAQESLNINRIYSPAIKTVQVFKEGFEMSSPVISLNSSEKIIIAFDALNEDLADYRFTVVHCDASWRTSENMSSSDYLQGYREENISEYAYSFNTTVNYIHYQAVFPTSTMDVKISGNYLLKVYREDPGSLAFTWRFMVVEPTPVTLSGDVGQSPYPAERTMRQQVNFVLRYNGFPISSPAQDLNVCVMQNGRWDNMLCHLQPVSVRGDELDYRNNDMIIFNGGNEFRSFDTKSLQYQSSRIARILYDTITQVFLTDDLPRSRKPYVRDPDINGRFLVRNEDHATRHEIESDYANVHFCLKTAEPDIRCRFFLLGAMNGYTLDANAELSYNPFRKCYEKRLLLKQGYFNYLIVCLPAGSGAGDETVIEGNHWETVNAYTVLVYYHPAGELYDRLISVTDIIMPE